ncbi:MULTISPECIES: phage tail tube protein [Pontibacillus]|uniref:Phage tail tube protein n=1 Tax=Pontibacillus chungwhensis TaxID=265426 RepID=A0ABY8V4A9_9BACI|nr:MULTISPECIES: phage tail tube protein [Pontibacillus]MCD5326143.1 phage tail tube protein [Pontibacillus sp. HN14]WIG00299.1 phage tail tube protein [Pontibacillus chungwhensis]
MAERLRYVGIAEETEYMQDPAPEAVVHLPFATFDINVTGDTVEEVPQGYDRVNEEVREAAYAVSGSIGYATDVNTIGYFLKWGLGGYALDSESMVHNFYGVNDYALPSFVARGGLDHTEMVYRGLVLDQISLSVDKKGRASFTGNVNGAKDEKAVLKNRDELITYTEKPIMFHEVKVEVDGKDVSAEIDSLSIDISNNTDMDGYGMNNRLPVYIEGGERATTFKHTLRFNNTKELEKFWGNSTGGGDKNGVKQFSVKYTLDRGVEGKVEIEIPRVYIQNPKHSVSNRDRAKQEINMKALPGDVTLSDSTKVRTDIYCRVENGVESY